MFFFDVVEKRVFQLTQGLVQILGVQVYPNLLEAKGAGAFSNVTI